MHEAAIPPAVLVIGSLNMDLSVRTSRLPGPGETVQGGQLRMAPGGKGANQATAARLLGCPVSIVGAVGDDDHGASLTAAAQRHGIDTSHVSIMPETATGSALIAIDDRGENTIIVSPGANARLLPSHVLKAEDLFAGAAVLCLSLEIPMPTARAAARTGKTQGTTVILNLSPYTEVPQDLLRDTDILLVNRHEASNLLKHPLPEHPDWNTVQQEFRRLGLPRAIVTLGPQGAAVLDSTGEDRPVIVEPVPVEAIDTTGCGDAFFGAIASRLAAGTTLQEAAVFAVRAAALAATREGTQTSYPTLAQVLSQDIPSAPGSPTS